MNQTLRRQAEIIDGQIVPLTGLEVIVSDHCNIACRHCFVSCGPKVTTHRMMTMEQVREALEEGQRQGLRQVWFTGGEPMLHPAFLDLVDLVHDQAPLGVLTNGMLVGPDMARALARRFHEGPYNLEIRVSLDGPTAAQNDRIRGPGAFEAACAGIEHLVQAGLEPIVAATVLDHADRTREHYVSLECTQQKRY